jgi:hypothetical protein
MKKARFRGLLTVSGSDDQRNLDWGTVFKSPSREPT